MKRAAAVACILLVAAFAALAVAVHFMDPGSLAVSLAASVKAETGRELSFGEVSVAILPRPALAISDVRFGNAAWGSQPWLAQAARVTADLDTMALLAGRLRINQFTVTDASLLLETDRNGIGNWVMGATQAPVPAWLQATNIDELALRAFTLTYRDGKTGKRTLAQIDSASIAGVAASQPFHVTVRATIDGKQVEAGGTLGALTALLDNAPAYPVDLDGKFGNIDVGVHGTIDEPRVLAGLKLALRAEAPESADVASLLGAKMPRLGAFRGTAQLTGSAVAPALTDIDVTIGASRAPEIKLGGAVANLRAASGIDLKVAATAASSWRVAAADGPRLPPFRASARVRDTQNGYRVDDLELKIADSRVNASLQVARGGPRWRIAGRAESQLIDLSHPAPAQESRSAGAAAPDSTRATDFWKLADVDLDLKFGRLVMPDGRELQAGSGRLALDDGRLKASALQVTLGGAQIKLNGTVADPQNVAGLGLDLALQGGELAELCKFFGASIAPVGPYQGRAHLHGALDAVGMTDILATAGRPGQSLRVSGQIDNAIKRTGMKLAIAANVSDSTAAGRLFGVELPRLPVWRASAQLTEAPAGYALDNVNLALGRTSVQGRVEFAAGEARPRVTANLSGALVDLSELPFAPLKPGAINPLLAADVAADIRFDRLVLRDRRALGPVSGNFKLAAGAIELKQFTVAVDGASAMVEGRINDPLTPAALELTVNARIAHGSGLANFSGLRLQNIPAFTASGRLTDVPDGYALAGLKLVHATTTVNGDVTITRSARRHKVTAKLISSLLDVSAFMPPATARGAPKKSATGGARAIPDVPLPLDILRAVDADLDLRIESVKLSDAAPLGPLLVRAVIADGRLKAEPVHLAITTGQTLKIAATADAAQSEWTLRVDATGIDFGELLARLGRPGVVTGGSTDLAVQFQGRGKSLAAIMGSLNGDARLKVGPHRVHNFAVNPDTSIVLRLFSLANPAQKTEPDTDVQCLTARVPVKDGVFTSERKVAAETAKYNAVFSGTVNLRTEAIDAIVTPVVKSVRGSDVNVLVQLHGTLAAPTVSVDSVGAVMKSAASVGAAVMTLGGSWLADSVIKKAAADPNPCATALAQ